MEQKFVFPKKFLTTFAGVAAVGLLLFLISWFLTDVNSTRLFTALLYN